jgi:hypothetical protein
MRQQKRAIGSHCNGELLQIICAMQLDNSSAHRAADRPMQRAVGRSLRRKQARPQQ